MQLFRYSSHATEMALLQQVYKYWNCSSVKSVPEDCAVLQMSLQGLKRKVTDEFTSQKNMQEQARKNPDNRVLHLVFNFEKKGLLSNLSDSPERYTSCLNCSLIYLGYLKATVVVATSIICLIGTGIRERANAVASMLHYSINLAKAKRAVLFTTIRLYADNCGVQNEKKFILWYLLWCATIWLDDNINFTF